MRRSAPHHTEPVNSDSFLDIVASVVSIMIIMVVMVGMKIKNGPVTVLSVCQDHNGKVKLLVAEGESVPGPILNIGNTNSRYRFSTGAKTFLATWAKAGPSQLNLTWFHAAAPRSVPKATAFSSFPCSS